MSSFLKTLLDTTKVRNEQAKKYGTITEFVDTINVVVESITGKSFSAIAPQQDIDTELVYRIGDGVIVVNGVIVGKAKMSSTIKTYNV